MDGVTSVEDVEMQETPRGEPGLNLHSKSTQQVHFCIGYDAPGAQDKNRHAASILTNILGGTMSSRLFQEIREKRGLCYSIGAYTSQYNPVGGALTIFGGTSPQHWDTMQELVGVELNKVKTEPVSEEELQEAKNNILGGLVLGLESMSARMQRMARNEIRYGRFIDTEETIEKIRAVSAKDLMDCANRFILEEERSTTAIGPF